MPTVDAQPDFAPPVCACPTCGVECRRHSVYPRTIRDISLDGPVTLRVPVGNYRCTGCQKFFKPEVPFAAKGKHYSTRAARKATISVQQDKTTYTALPNRLSRDFSINPAKSTCWDWFQEFAGSIDIEDYLRWACSRFSGQLSVDSVVDGGVHMWFATDPLNKDLILGYHRDKHANSESLAAFLTTLRDQYGIRPLLFTHDDAAVFDSTPESVWPGVPMQLCHFHAMRRLTYMHLRHSLKKRLDKLRPVQVRQPSGHQTPEVMRARERYRKKHKAWVKLHRKRRLFFKSVRSLQEPKSVELKEARFLEVACKRYKALRRFRQFILDFYGVFDCKDRETAELVRRAFVAKWSKYARKDEAIIYVVKRFADDAYFAKLFPFTAFENAHRTTNSTERANRWFRKRQKSHYRNRREHTIRNMLHADLIVRRERTDTDEPPAQLKPKAVESRESA